METGLRDRTVIVTGATGGIGGAIAHAFAAEGAAVALTFHRDQRRAAELVEEIRSTGGRAAAVPFDQSQPDAGARLVGDVESQLGPPDVVIANAVEWPTNGSEIEGLRGSLTANVIGPLALIDAALGRMRERAFGRIVFMSTDIVGQPMAGPLAYATAKGGLETAARVLAVREARYGILTNVVRPGFTLTERVRTDPRFGEDAIAAERAKTPTHRICTPSDVASAAVYLGSLANTHVNGQTISVAGGRELTR